MVVIVALAASVFLTLLTLLLPARGARDFLSVVYEDEGSEVAKFVRQRGKWRKVLVRNHHWVC